MKLYLIILLFTFGKFSAQVNSGLVQYEVLNIDTVNGVILNYTDSTNYIYSYSFSEGYSRTDFGFPYRIQTTIINSEGYFELENTSTQRNYFFSPSIPNISIDSLLNQLDSSEIAVVIAQEYKSIMGYECQKAIYTNKIGVQQSSYFVWYTNQIKGNTIIPKAGISTLNLNGLILEYEYPDTIGKTIIRAKTIDLSPVNSILFFPDLSGYTLLNQN